MPPKAAKLPAQFNLGVLYDSRLDDNGYAIEGDRAEAIKWMLAAAEQGLPRAQSRLAELYADWPECFAKLRERVCLVPAGGNQLARHTPPPGSIRVRADRRPANAGATHQGETPGRTPADTEPRNPTAQRRASAMRAWFVPPLVIPIFVVLMVVAFAAYQAL